MFFNPLFLQVINNQESLSIPKTQKLNGASYLFSDIIKVCFDNNEPENIKPGNEQTEQGNISSVSNLLPGGLNLIAASDQIQAKDQSASAEQTLLNLMQNLLPQKFNLTAADASQSSVNLSESNDKNMNSLILNEGEVTSLISKLLDNNYQGKVNILSTKEGFKKAPHKSIGINSEDNLSSDKLSPYDLLEILKLGNAVALESSGSENNPGLLISLVEVNNQKTELDKISGASLIDVKKNISIDDSESEQTIHSKDSKDVNELLTDVDKSNSSAGQEVPLLYQVELSIIQNNQNSASELPSDNYSPNMDKLQELVNSKNIKLQDGNTSNNNTLNQKLILQDNKNPNINAEDYEDYTGGVIKEINFPSEFINLNEANTQENNKIVGNTVGGNTDISKIANKNGQGTNSEQVIGISEQSKSVELPDLVISKTRINSNVSQDSSQDPSISKNNSASTKISAEEKLPGNEDLIKSENLKTEDEFTVDESKLDADNSGKIEVNKSDNEIQRNDSVTGDANSQNPVVSNELKVVQGKKSRIIKDLNLSIKSTKLKKEDQSIPEQIADTQIPDVQKNKVTGKTEVSEINSFIKSTKEKDSLQHSDTKIEDGQISEKAFAKQAADLGTSAKEKEINVISVDKTDNKTEAAKNSNEGNISKDNNSGNKDTSHLSQDQQPASQDKNEFRSRVQENHISGSDMVRNADNTVKEKIPFEAKSFASPVRTVKAAEIMKEISGFIQQNSDHTLTLKIDPESLGTVKIALDVVDKMIHANIEVENDAARKMVETNLNQLYNSLNQNGVQINSLNISLANSDQKQSRGFSTKRKIYQTNGEDDYDEKNVNESRKMGYNTYEYLI